MYSEYSDSWMVNYHPVYSCVTAVHPRSRRVHGSTVIQNLLLWMRIGLSTVYCVLAYTCVWITWSYIWAAQDFSIHIRTTRHTLLPRGHVHAVLNLVGYFFGMYSSTACHISNLPNTFSGISEHSSSTDWVRFCSRLMNLSQIRKRYAEAHRTPVPGAV